MKNIELTLIVLVWVAQCQRINKSYKMFCRKNLLLITCVHSIIFFLNFKAQAQIAPTKDAVKISSLVNKYVHKYYKADSAAMANCCEKGVLFVKFNVDSTSQITGLSYTDKTPEFIHEALASALKHIESDIFLINEMKKLKSTFLLPVVYDYKAGCNYHKISPGEKYYSDYMMMEGRSDNFHMSLLKMLVFTDGYHPGLSCVILNGVNVGSGMY